MWIIGFLAKMVRNYKRKKPAVDQSKMKAAVIAVRCKNMSRNKAADFYGVSRASLTNYLKQTTEEQAQSGDVAVRVHGHKTV